MDGHLDNDSLIYGDEASAMQDGGGRGHDQSEDKQEDCTGSTGQVTLRQANWSYKILKECKAQLQNESEIVRPASGST